MCLNFTPPDEIKFFSSSPKNTGSVTISDMARNQIEKIKGAKPVLAKDALEGASAVVSLATTLATTELERNRRLEAPAGKSQLTQ